MIAGGCVGGRFGVFVDAFHCVVSTMYDGITQIGEVLLKHTSFYTNDRLVDLGTNKSIFADAIPFVVSTIACGITLIGEDFHIRSYSTHDRLVDGGTNNGLGLGGFAGGFAIPFVVSTIAYGKTQIGEDFRIRSFTTHDRLVDGGTNNGSVGGFVCWFVCGFVGVMGGGSLALLGRLQATRGGNIIDIGGLLSRLQATSAGNIIDIGGLLGLPQATGGDNIMGVIVDNGGVGGHCQQGDSENGSSEHHLWV